MQNCPNPDCRAVFPTAASTRHLLTCPHYVEQPFPPLESVEND